MTWLSGLQGCDELKDFIRHTQVSVIVSNTDGKILWANKAFTDWSGYTVAELVRWGWKQLSVPGDNLDEDISLSANWDAFAPIYSVRKQYHRKDREPVWGVMTAMRFPQSGEIKFCVCTWIPKDEESNETARVVQAIVRDNAQVLSKLTSSIEKLTQTSEEQLFIMTAANLAKKYPKMTWAVVVFVFGIFGLNNVLDVLRAVNIVPPAITHVDNSSTNP